jgi:hypothetical protein
VRRSSTNVAHAVRPVVIVTLQVDDAPAHAPDQPPKCQPAAGVAQPGAEPQQDLQAAGVAVRHLGHVQHDPARAGVLAGLQDRVAGPVVACFSRHDTAVGVFYPLAARAAGPETGFEALGFRWGALGRNGHQPAAREFSLNPIGVGYDFARSGLVNIDTSWLGGNGPPPYGAHADICHPELAWISLCAGGLCWSPSGE